MDENKDYSAVRAALTGEVVTIMEAWELNQDEVSVLRQKVRELEGKLVETK